MTKITALFKFIGSIGIDESMNSQMSRKIRLTNIFGFTLLILMSGLGILFIPFSEIYRNLNITRALLGPVYALPILLNKFRLYTISRFYIILTPLIAVVSIGAVLGGNPATSLKIALMPAILLPLLIFGINEKIKMIIGIILVVSSITLIDFVAEIAPLQEGIPIDIFNTYNEINNSLIVSISMYIIAFIQYQILLINTENSAKEEFQRGEKLLTNILPKEIIPALKESPEVIADYFEETSILFADIANFTPLANRLPPHELVKLLDQIFSHFDEIVEKHDIEKIKTIGDCYMVAAGVPQKREDHAKVLVQIAIEFKEYLNKNKFHGEPLNIRIGISSGPVVAGVIGRKKFIYDLWGDTVNTASRMESYGNKNEIQITEETKRLIEPYFHCEELTYIKIKGKGFMPIFVVKGVIAQPGIIITI